MTTRNALPLALVATWMGTGCIVQSEPINLRDQDIRLTVLHTSDWHSRLIPYVIDPPAPVQTLGLLPENAPFGGAARMKTILDQERARSERVLHVDSGDCFQGAPIFNQFSGEPEIRALTLSGIDAMVIGNHEFDLGATNFVDQAAKWAGFPFLAANYNFRDPRLLGNNGLADVAQDVAVINVQGLRVLVIGLGNISSLTSIGKGGNSLQITPWEPNDVVRNYVNLYAGSVDLVFVLSHLGLEVDAALVEGYDRFFDLAEVSPDELQRHWDCTIIEEASTASCRIPPVRGIDAIFGGHLHIVLNPPRVLKDVDGRDVLLVHSGAFMQFVGRLDTVVREAERFNPPRDKFYGWEMLTHRYRPIPVDKNTPPDHEMVRLLEPYQRELAENVDLARPVAWALNNIVRTNPNGGDSQMGNLVAGAMLVRNRVRSDFVMTNSLGIRDNLNTGTITLEELYNVFPFENTITTMFLSGREVQELMDFIAIRSRARGCRTQAQVANVSLVMRCDCAVSDDGCCAPGPGGVKPFACSDDVRIGGVPINPNGSYQLGTNDYVAQGGSGFEVLRRNTTQKDSGIPLRTAVEEFLSTFPRCDYERQVKPQIDATLASQPEEGERLQREWESITRFGTPPCIDGSHLVDGRIKRRLGG
ncbi:MAG: bifunctional UDP-sugar hydrolase/5'-nucleotidase [Myxococcota bacterium]